MKIPITKPYFTKDEFEIIQEPLKTGWVVQGPFVQKFEKAISKFIGAKYSIALNSCTSGQFIMSRIIDLKPEDEVIMPAFTWISTANSVEFLGAKAVFCDINLDTFNIDSNKIKSLITNKTKAIYPVNLFGLPAELEKISQIAQKFNLRVIEDSACGLGGFINEKHCGTFGDAAVFSFHPRKSITSGEGGMIITDKQDIAEKARSLRDHGAVKSDLERHKANGGFLLTEYPMLGYNYRMTDIQGALGFSQSQKIPIIFQKKQELAAIYDSKVDNISWLRKPLTPDKFTHGYQTYCCLFKPDEAQQAIDKRDIDYIDRLHEERNAVMLALEKKGIATRQGTHSVHIQKYYREKYQYLKEDFIKSYTADRLTMALPFFPQMTTKEIEYLFEKLKQIKV